MVVISTWYGVPSFPVSNILINPKRTGFLSRGSMFLKFAACSWSIMKQFRPLSIIDL